uniref:Uncharacterized protein n=1 Tax=Steinernema glaseri TaxID=37863 RepID=A0A1I7ZHT6_9BILA
MLIQQQAHSCSREGLRLEIIHLLTAVQLLSFKSMIFHNEHLFREKRYVFLCVLLRAMYKYYVQCDTSERVQNMLIWTANVTFNCCFMRQCRKGKSWFLTRMANFSAHPWHVMDLLLSARIPPNRKFRDPRFDVFENNLLVIFVFSSFFKRFHRFPFPRLSDETVTTAV